MANVAHYSFAEIRSLCDVSLMGNACHRFTKLKSALACTFALTACAEGWNASESASRNWLPVALPHLKRVIVLLRICHPRRASGYNNIWVDGSNDDERLYCSFGPEGNIEIIRDELKQAGVLGVSYTPSDSPTKPVNSVSFILFRQGIVTSGSMTSVNYSAQPQPCANKTEGDDSFRVMQRSISAAPCRWFWERFEG